MVELLVFLFFIYLFLTCFPSSVLDDQMRSQFLKREIASREKSAYRDAQAY